MCLLIRTRCIIYNMPRWDIQSVAAQREDVQFFAAASPTVYTPPITTTGTF